MTKNSNLIIFNELNKCKKYSYLQYKGDVKYTGYKCNAYNMIFVYF